MKTKKLTKTMCCAFMAAACFLCGAAMLNVSADEAITTESFAVNATSIRYSDPDGIRFRTSISKTEFDKMKEKDENLTAGTLYLPTEILGEGNSLTIANAADTVAENKRAGKIEIPSEKIKEVTDGEGDITDYEFYTYVYDIPQKYYNKPITAVGYIYCDGHYYYSSSLSKSLAYTAQQAYVGENKTEALKYIPDEEVNYTVNVYLQNKDGSYNETPTETKTLSGKINATATVDKKNGYEPMNVTKEEISEDETIYYANDGLIWADGSTVINQYYAKEIKKVTCASLNRAESTVDYKENGAYAEVFLASHNNSENKKYNYANYIALEDTYDAGSNYMRFEFKGANPIGGVYFGIQGDFSSSLNEVKGSGLDLNVSSTNGGVRLLAPTSGSDSYDDITGSVGGSIKTSDSTTAFVSTNHKYFNNNSSKDFVLIVGTSKVSNANRYRLYVYLYEKNGTELMLLEQFETSNVTNMHFSHNGKIMVVSECNYGNNSKFTMWRPTTLEKAMAQLNEDYTITSTTESEE